MWSSLFHGMFTNVAVIMKIVISASLKNCKVKQVSVRFFLWSYKFFQKLELSVYCTPKVIFKL